MNPSDGGNKNLTNALKEKRRVEEHHRQLVAQLNELRAPSKSYRESKFRAAGTASDMVLDSYRVTSPAAKQIADTIKETLSALDPSDISREELSAVMQQLNSLLNMIGSLPDKDEADDLRRAITYVKDTYQKAFNKSFSVTGSLKNKLSIAGVDAAKSGGMRGMIARSASALLGNDSDIFANSMKGVLGAAVRSSGKNKGKKPTKLFSADIIRKRTQIAESNIGKAAQQKAVRMAGEDSVRGNVGGVQNEGPISNDKDFRKRLVEGVNRTSASTEKTRQSVDTLSKENRFAVVRSKEYQVELLDTVNDIRDILMGQKSGTTQGSPDKKKSGLFGALGGLLGIIGGFAAARALKGLVGIKKAFKGASKLLKKFPGRLLKLATLAGGAIWSGVSGAFKAIKGALTGEKMKNALNGLKSAISNMKDKVVAAWDKLKNIGSDLVDNVKTKAKSIWDSARTHASNAWDKTKDLSRAVRKKVINIARGGISGLKSIGENIQRGTGELGASARERAKSAIDKLKPLGKKAGSILGKAALPVTIGLGAYQGYEAYKAAIDSGMSSSDAMNEGLGAAGKYIGTLGMSEFLSEETNAKIQAGIVRFIKGARETAAKVGETIGNAGQGFSSRASAMANSIDGGVLDPSKVGSVTRMAESSGNYATINTKEGNGSVSYGAYQINSRSELPTFLKKSGYASHFSGMGLESPEFQKKWQEISRSDSNFNRAQDAYANERNASTLMRIAKQLGLSENEAMRLSSGKIGEIAGSVLNQYGYDLAKTRIRGALGNADLSTSSDSKFIEELNKQRLIHAESDFKTHLSKTKQSGEDFVGGRIENEMRALAKAIIMKPPAREVMVNRPQAANTRTTEPENGSSNMAMSASPSENKQSSSPQSINVVIAGTDTMTQLTRENLVTNAGNT